ncbi:MAG: hypothetical protein HN338_04285 [Candidatus Ruthia sp.]|nr:hypothetical protein [Candidatus Ruthturnera sp.]MBT6922220.1 hypothetical protein [Candidatus Ruthturnera sp.]
MKKHLIAISIAMTLTTTVSADNKQGFDNLEDFGSTLGRTVDTGFNKVIDGINYIFELPNDTKKWTVSQVEELKDRICEKPTTIIKEVIKEVEVIKVVEKIINVPAMPKERQCSTKRQSDRFGNVDEVITCTEWK